jgi:pimeloyl-ACP methyl ester carboxylesterase
VPEKFWEWTAKVSAEIFVLLKKIAMKMKERSILKGIIVALLLFSFAGCHNWFKDDDDEPETNYLVSYEMVRSYLPVLVESLFDELVQQYPDMEQVRDRVKHGIIIYEITYKTTFNGEQKIASGLVSVPTGEGSFPVISYQNGTNTLHSNAPSENPNFELYMLLEAIASTGFVIALPDYLGFGSSDNMFHPYLHKESTVQSVLDMLRAVKELSVLRDVVLNNELYLTGYSQGGWATMQVQKAIETEHSGEFDLKASSPGAGPYNLSFINEYILSQETYPMPYFAAYMFNSYMNLDEMFTPIDSVFNYPYDSIVPTLFDGTLSGVEINEFLTTSVEELFTENYRQFIENNSINSSTDTTFTPLIQALEENSIAAWNTSIPTRITHGNADMFVPFQVSENIVDEFHQKGATQVQLVEILGADHTQGIVPAGLYAIKWFLDLTE